LPTGCGRWERMGSMSWILSSRMRILRKGGRAIDWCTVIVIDSFPTSARQAVATVKIVSKVCAYIKSNYLVPFLDLDPVAIVYLRGLDLR